MAAWTSRAAALMSRLRSNWRVIPVEPSPLEGRGDGGSHGFRAGAGQTCADTNGGKINLRQGSDRQKTKRNRAGKKNSKGEQRSGDGPANERRGEIGRKVH